jgi:hypothetical protein
MCTCHIMYLEYLLDEWCDVVSHLNMHVDAFIKRKTQCGLGVQIFFLPALVVLDFACFPAFVEGPFEATHDKTSQLSLKVEHRE